MWREQTSAIHKSYESQYSSLLHGIRFVTFPPCVYQRERLKNGSPSSVPPLALESSLVICFE